MPLSPPNVDAVDVSTVGITRLRLVGGSRAARRYSGARSTSSQSSLAARGARKCLIIRVLLAFLVFVSRGCRILQPLTRKHSPLSLFLLSPCVTRIFTYIYVHTCTQCVSREIQVSYRSSNIRIYRSLRIIHLPYTYILFTRSYCSISWTKSATIITVCSMCDQ